MKPKTALPPRSSYTGSAGGSQAMDAAQRAPFAASHESVEELTSSPEDDCNGLAIQERHRARALTLLEGDGTPPTAGAGNDIVSAYFKDKMSLEDQRMIQGTRKMKESTLLDKIAAAGKCLDQMESSVGDAGSARHSAGGGCDAENVQATITVDNVSQVGPWRSQWSDSSPSAPGQSATASGNASTSQVELNEFACSIGFPSITTPLDLSALSNAVPADYLTNRPGSHNLGKGPSRVIGDIRAVRQGISSRYNDYSSQRLSNKTKQNSKSQESPGLPNPAHSSQRGRSSNIDEPEQAGKPRSKSRKGLHKIKGLWSGLLERRNVPPVPEMPADAAATSSHACSQYTTITAVPRSDLDSNNTAPEPTISAALPGIELSSHLTKVPSNPAVNPKSAVDPTNIEPPPDETDGAEGPGIEDSSINKVPTSSDDALTLAENRR